MIKRTPAYAAAISYAAAMALPLDSGGGAPNNPGVICLANETRFVESYFNEPLTTYAVGWRDPANIEATLDAIVPRVTVPRRFTYREWTNKEEFYSELDDIRSIGSDFKRVEYTGKETEGKTLNKGLTVLVDLDEIADKAGWEQMVVGKLMRRLARNDLRRTITLLDSNATNTAKTWNTDAGKDPDQDVLTDLITAADASGIRPNRVLYGETAWDKRGLSHRAQDTAGGYASASLTPEQLASLLNVDRVIISRERYQSSASQKTKIVNNLVIEFLQSQSIDIEDPSNVKRFVSPTDGGTPVRVYTQQISAKLYVVTVEHYSNIVLTSSLGLRKLTIS